jgi:voltage-gated potassium channel
VRGGTASSLRHRIKRLLDGDDASLVGRAINIGLLALIVVNVVALMLETVESLRVANQRLFTWIEVVSVALFTVEYLLRLWVCTLDPRYRAPVLGRLRFVLTPLALLDLLAILPFFVPLLGVDLRSARVPRLLRLFRLAKLARYSRSLRVFGRVAAAKLEELMTIVLLLIMMLVVASTFMYFAEHDAQPRSFTSIPATMWWTIATLTTVGYGDMCPVTGLGQLLGAVIALLGIGVFALPTGILGAAFVDELRRSREPTRCPHCGEPVDPD